MGADEQSFRIDGAVELPFVDRALDELDALWARTAAGSDEDRMMFALALSEVATNIVRHTTSATSMSVEVAVSDDALTATLRDDAEPVEIEWAAVKMPGTDAEGGRGLALARSALDVLAHDAGERGSVWTLVRRLTPRTGIRR